jgi:FkbM family methyltransferase
MAGKFQSAVAASIKKNLQNDFGKENFDEERFGPYTPPARRTSALKRFIKGLINHGLEYQLQMFDRMFGRFNKEFERVYMALSPADQQLFVDLVTYRVLGYQKVKLPLNNASYREAVKKAESLRIDDVTYDPHFLHVVLKKFDLNAIGFDVKLFLSAPGVVSDFIIEQYKYNKQGKTIEVKPGDVVLDVGGCWGDTALYFASKAGPAGKVYSFEFIPDNIKLFNTNISFNHALEKRVELVKHPATNVSGTDIYFKDNGPGSKVQTTPFEGQTGSCKTISIDDFVDQYKVSKVDFIKMDIEGSEMAALQGAERTIRKHKPKLAIATYHSISDFVNIPLWILDLDLGYRIYIDHFTIHSEETICFAQVGAS